MLIVVSATGWPENKAAAVERPLAIILTDVGQDPDDTQSLVRALLYSNDVSIQGIIPTYNPRGPVRVDIVQAVIAAYKKDLPFLKLHDTRYPSAELLLGRVKSGLNTNSQIGSGFDSSGSNHIIYMVDRSTVPMWILVWGGGRELAQAIFKVRSTRSNDEFVRFQKKLRVYSISLSQYSPEPGDYLLANAKDMFWIASIEHDGSKTATFRGMYMLGDNSMQSESWTQANITSRGNLGRMYPLNTTENGLKEGDTPSLLHILPIGLGTPGLPKAGGWGGRYTKESDYYRISQNLYTSKYQLDQVGDVSSRRLSVARWRKAFQADFAARAKWLISSYGSANHPPDARITGASALTVPSGQTVPLDATPSTDPDGNGLSYHWWVYREAGSHTGSMTIENDRVAVTSLVAPQVTSTKTVHVILEVTDSGSPALTRYQRLVLTVNP